ncbi:protein FAM19A1-like isoform X1 [Arapaima gigas]
MLSACFLTAGWIIETLPDMSWLLCLGFSMSAMLLCQASLYDTLQQHRVARPGMSTIQILGESKHHFFLLSQQPSRSRFGSSRGWVNGVNRWNVYDAVDHFPCEKDPGNPNPVQALSPCLHGHSIS